LAHWVRNVNNESMVLSLAAFRRRAQGALMHSHLTHQPVVVARRVPPRATKAIPISRGTL
jgi:hypothetical protein